MNATDTPIDERIRAFAASVRRHLDDLPADELDEILSGLTADLADQAADNDGVLDLGDPAEYAAELRSAAGLPPRGASRSRQPFRRGLTAWRQELGDGIRRLRSTPVGAWLLDFLVALRPVWWVLRGCGMYALVTLLGTLLPPYGDSWGMPSHPLQWMLLLALVVVSVQWGRGRWMPTRWLRHLRTATSVLAVLLIPAVLGALLVPRVEYVDAGGYPPQGLLLDGVQVGNIFAFDENGEPIEHVQLFTDKGTPLSLYGGYSSDMQVGQLYEDGETVPIPFRDFRKQPVWNIYPLDEGTINVNTGEPKKSSITQPAPPFLRAPSVSSTGPKPTPTPVPTDGVTDPSPEPTPAP